MASWLQNLFKTPAKTAKGGRASGVPTKGASQQKPIARAPQQRPAPPQSNLPNATIIYGIGAGILYVAALFLLLGGKWFSAIEVCFLAAGLTGFALHLLKHQD